MSNLLHYFYVFTTFCYFFVILFFKLGWFVFVYLVSFRENIFGIHTTLVMVHKSNDCCRSRVIVAFLWLFCQSFVMRFSFCSVKEGVFMGFKRYHPLGYFFEFYDDLYDNKVSGLCESLFVTNNTSFGNKISFYYFVLPRLISLIIVMGREGAWSFGW